MNLKLNDPIYIQWNTDNNGEYIESLKITSEAMSVFAGRAVLMQLPDDVYGVRIHDESGNPMYEVKRPDTLLEENEFRVDYLNGFVTFNPNKNGKTVVVQEYYGRGFILYPASRIYADYNADTGEISGTLKEFIEQIQPYIYRGIYNPTYNYNPNNQVFHRGSTYINLIQSIGVDPTNTINWRVFAKGLWSRGTWSDANTYSSGDVVYSQDLTELYMSLKDDNTSPLTDTSNWELMISVKSVYSTLQTIIDNWNNTTKPEIDQYIQDMLDIKNEWTTVLKPEMQALIGEVTVTWVDV